MDAPMSAVPDAIRPDAALIAALEGANYHPLWDRYKRITPMAPGAKDSPMHWRWKDFEPFTVRAAREVPIEDVERRAIIMVNPAFGGATTTTANLIGAFTILNPGDRAVPHRHTASAIRFATRAAGACTIVNGRRCAMNEGDLVLTPPMCWHGHINQGEERTAWFDAANMPLVCNLDASFFEPGTRGEEAFWEVDEGDERLWKGAGMAVPGESAAVSAAHSAKYHYPGEVTRALLASIPSGADGARLLRYTNPVTGGAVMPSLDCYAMRLAKGAGTRARRSTANAICLVVSGSGSSTVGNTSFGWQKHDVFTIPHWTWASHTAAEGDADLFVVTDRAVYEHLGLLREEMQ
jgi:gentisate 1,2-dioxygenase